MPHGRMPAQQMEVPSELTSVVQSDFPACRACDRMSFRKLDIHGGTLSVNRPSWANHLRVSISFPYLRSWTNHSRLEFPGLFVPEPQVTLRTDNQCHISAQLHYDSETDSEFGLDRLCLDEIRPPTPTRHEPLSLLTVNYDVRAIIFELLLMDTKRIRVRDEDKHWWRGDCCKTLRKLSLTCRQLHDEAKLIFYQKNTFYFERPADYTRFWHRRRGVDKISGSLFKCLPVGVLLTEFISNRFFCCKTRTHSTLHQNCARIQR